MNWLVRVAFASLARLACEEFVKGKTPRIIMDREGGSVYLERYYIFGGPSEDGEWADAPIGVYLHRFRRSDDDQDLHNHPWEGSVSFILAGGYDEERRIGDDVVSRRFDPFSFNIIHANDFHRVDLLEQDAWSIFVVGRKAQSWGFWNRTTKLFMPWREFIAKKRGVDPASIDDNVKRSEDLGR
jgi:hypothetical protein